MPGVPGLLAARVDQRDHRRLVVDHLLHLPDGLLALLRVELARLQREELVVLRVGPDGLVPHPHLVAGVDRDEEVGVDVADPAPEEHVVVRFRLAVDGVPHLVAQRGLTDHLEVDPDADLPEPPGDELAALLAHDALVASQQTELDRLAALVLADAVAVGVLVAGGVESRLGLLEVEGVLLGGRRLPVIVEVG